MNCLDLETLALVLERSSDDPEHRRVREHARECSECEEHIGLLGDIDVILDDAAMWDDPAAECLPSLDVLELLSGEDERPRHLHLLSCGGCQGDVTALSEVLLEDARERVSPQLRARLRRLASSDQTTVEEYPAVGSTVRRRASGRSNTSSRRSGTRSGSRSGTRSGGIRRRGSGSRRSAVRPSVRVLSGRGAAPQQPTWAWSVLAAAAVLLVAFALVLSPDDRSSVAQAPVLSEQLQEPGNTVRVSDVQGQEPAERPRDEGLDPPEIDPSYPLPPIEPERRPRDETQPEAEPAEPTPLARGEQPPVEPSQGTDEGERTSERPRRAEQEPAATPSTSPTPPTRRYVDDGGRLTLALGNLNGSVQVWERGWKKLSKQRGEALALQPGDRLRSRGGGFVSLDEGRFELCLDRETELVVRAAAGGPVLGLLRGRLACEVASLPKDEHFVISTEQGDFSVLGTVFAVEARTDAARVVVAEGTVKAANGLGETQVAAGHGVAMASRVRPGPAQRADLQELAWMQALAPKRQVFYAATFEERKLAGFRGELSQEHAPRGGSALLLNTLSDNRYWGLAARVQARRISGFRAMRDGYLSFSIYSEEPTAVLVQVTNDSQKKQFKRSLHHPGGYWRTFTVPLMELSTYYEPGKNPVREGDLFTDLGIYAGRPGDTREERPILLDDVQIYRKHYR